MDTIVTEKGFDANGNRIIEIDGVGLMVVDANKGKMYKFDPEKEAREQRAAELVANFDAVDYSYIAKDKDTGKETVVRTMTKKAVKPISGGRVIGAVEYLDSNGKEQRAIATWSVSKRWGAWCLDGGKGSVSNLTSKDLDTMLAVQQDIGWIQLG